jgi:hypothetical protein
MTSTVDRINVALVGASAGNADEVLQKQLRKTSMQNH